MDRVLDVYQDGLRIGSLHDEQPLRFSYEAEWLKRPDARAIAPTLPLQTTAFSGDRVHAFFENLLPEGPVRRLLQANHHTTSVFGLLRSVAGDTAGSLTLLPPGESPLPPRYTPTTWRRIAEEIRKGTALTVGSQPGGNLRISLAGAQDKLLLMVLPDGQPALPQGTAPSSHILKPDIHGLAGVWASALNETLIMTLAADLGLGVAQVEYQADTRACLIRRYDRAPDNSGGLTRLHQLDVCQLAGIPSDIKYETDGGPSLKECRRLLQDIGVPAGDLQRLLQWVVFNLCIGNHDSHAKNLSVLAQGNGWRLAPFYDLMCTTLYPALSRQFAFRIGNTSIPGQIDETQIRAMATELGFSPRYVMTVARDICKSLPASLDRTSSELLAIAHPGAEHTLIERLAQRVREETQKFTRRWAVG